MIFHVFFFLSFCQSSIKISDRLKQRRTVTVLCQAKLQAILCIFCFLFSQNRWHTLIHTQTNVTLIGIRMISRNAIQPLAQIEEKKLVRKKIKATLNLKSSLTCIDVVSLLLSISICHIRISRDQCKKKQRKTNTH